MSAPITEGITFVEPEELATKLEQRKNGDLPDNNFVVIDVRNPDEIASSGAIRGKLNIPSGEFSTTANAKDILRGHLDKQEIVVHCLKSQQRGPTCALALSKALEELQAEAGSDAKLPEIKVLRGGFQSFDQQYGSTDLVEK